MKILKYDIVRDVTAPGGEVAPCPAARQSLSKLAEMLASASIFNSLAGIAVDVISLEGDQRLSLSRSSVPMPAAGMSRSLLK